MTRNRPCNAAGNAFCADSRHTSYTSPQAKAPRTPRIARLDACTRCRALAIGRVSPRSLRRASSDTITARWASASAQTSCDRRQRADAPWPGGPDDGRSGTAFPSSISLRLPPSPRPREKGRHSSSRFGIRTHFMRADSPRNPSIPLPPTGCLDLPGSAWICLDLLIPATSRSRHPQACRGHRG